MYSFNVSTRQNSRWFLVTQIVQDTQRFLNTLSGTLNFLFYTITYLLV